MAAAGPKAIMYLFSRTAAAGRCRTLTIATTSRSSLRWSRSAQLHQLPFWRKGTSSVKALSRCAGGVQTLTMTHGSRHAARWPELIRGCMAVTPVTTMQPFE